MTPEEFEKHFTEEQKYSFEKNMDEYIFWLKMGTAGFALGIFIYMVFFQ